MYPWCRILLPTDFSTASQWAFDEAVALAGSCNAEIMILHVRMTRTSRPSELRFPADASLYSYAEQHELALIQERIQRRNSSVPTRLVVTQGPDPSVEVTRVARDESVDLIVMSTHARHHVAHLIIGSTTMSLLASPPAPLLAIRYGTKKRTAMQRIVVPVHPKQPTFHALDLAANIARHDGGEVHVVTICNADGEAPAAKTFVDQLVQERLAGVRAQARLIHGRNVEAEVVRYADTSDADVICINGETSKASEIGVVKQEIVRRTGTPILIVPAA
jgi:nucleotide-binding universal stress UspA family protein